jgi:hypothetical protein
LSPSKACTRSTSRAGRGVAGDAPPGSSCAILRRRPLGVASTNPRRVLASPGWTPKTSVRARSRRHRRRPPWDLARRGSSRPLLGRCVSSASRSGRSATDPGGSRAETRIPPTARPASGALVPPRGSPRSRRSACVLEARSSARIPPISEEEYVGRGGPLDAVLRRDGAKGPLDVNDPAHCARRLLE